MKIAIVGGGTAGTMAATHLAWAFPQAELIQIASSRIPIIGVGESTAPAVSRWLDQVGGPSFEELRERCGATLKRASCFEGWGRRHARFLHRFQPTGDYAYHFDARQLVEILQSRLHTERVDALVTAIDSDGAGAVVTLDHGAQLSCDYVIDARGFPPQDDPHVLRLSCIPTNAALVQSSIPLPPLEDHPEVTRVIARPHGWVFAIPLVSRTALGYVHNDALCTPAELEADFEALLHQLGGEPVEARRLLRFPSFVHRAPFDGALMRVGNTASFTEPLEALNISTIVFQLRSFTQWSRGQSPDARPDSRRLASFNEALASYTRRNAVFLGWHYAEGSRYGTRFWEHARTCFSRAVSDPALRDDVARFHQMARAAQALKIDDLDRIADREQWNREVFPRMQVLRPFGTFSALNVAQVGRGIGWFPAPEAAPTDR